MQQGDRLLDPIDRLSDQLARARADGYGVRHYADGVVSVGVPVGRPPLGPGRVPGGGRANGRSDPWSAARSNGRGDPGGLRPGSPERFLESGGTHPCPGPSLLPAHRSGGRLVASPFVSLVIRSPSPCPPTPVRPRRSLRKMKTDSRRPIAWRPPVSLLARHCYRTGTFDAIVLGTGQAENRWLSTWASPAAGPRSSSGVRRRPRASTWAARRPRPWSPAPASPTWPGGPPTTAFAPARSRSTWAACRTRKRAVVDDFGRARATRSRAGRNARSHPRRRRASRLPSCVEVATPDGWHPDADRRAVFISASRRRPAAARACLGSDGVPTP